MPLDCYALLFVGLPANDATKIQSRDAIPFGLDKERLAIGLILASPRFLDNLGMGIVGKVEELAVFEDNAGMKVTHNFIW